MMRSPLLSAVAAAAMFALVQGCSRAAEPPPSDETSGADTPGDDDDDNGAAPVDAPPTATTPAPAPTAPAPPAPEPPKPKSEMTFFVTSAPAGINDGQPAPNGNLGGLAGADETCKKLAAAVKGDDHTWAAYLSANGINAKDRIGPGPWKNQKGKVIATDVASLHQVGLQLGPDLLDEKGAAVPPNARYVFTGSKLDGTATNNTCNNWTSAQNNQTGTVGDGLFTDQANPNIGAGWNHAALVPANARLACGGNGLTQNKGQARIYCFAKD